MVVGWPQWLASTCSICWGRLVDMTKWVNFAQSPSLWKSHTVWLWWCIVHCLIPLGAIITHTPSTCAPSTHSLSHLFIMPSPTPLTTPYSHNIVACVMMFVCTWGQTILVAEGEELLNRAHDQLITEDWIIRWVAFDIVLFLADSVKFVCKVRTPCKQVLDGCLPAWHWVGEGHCRTFSSASGEISCASRCVRSVGERSNSLFLFYSWNTNWLPCSGMHCNNIDIDGGDGAQDGSRGMYIQLSYSWVVIVINS